MSWGIKITILYLGFVAMILSLVTLTMREKVDLVTKDYYQQELQFQDKIDKINLTNSLAEQVSWNLTQESLTVQFPHEFKNETITGSIHFFRPSDSAMDKTFQLAADSEGKQVIPVKELNKGVYKIQISWNVGKKAFYNEGVIRLK